jgi:hypothetical protein
MGVGNYFPVSNDKVWISNLTKQVLECHIIILVDILKRVALMEVSLKKL